MLVARPVPCNQASAMATTPAAVATATEAATEMAAAKVTRSAEAARTGAGMHDAAAESTMRDRAADMARADEATPSVCVIAVMVMTAPPPVAATSVQSPEPHAAVVVAGPVIACGDVVGAGITGTISRGIAGSCIGTARQSNCSRHCTGRA